MMPCIACEKPRLNELFYWLFIVVFVIFFGPILKCIFEQSLKLLLHTAVSSKVVLRERKTLRDNVESYYG